MSATPSQGIRYPSDGDSPNVPIWLQRLAEDSEQHGISFFASSTDRTSKLAAPVDGQLSYLRDVKRYEAFIGSAWVPLLTGPVSQDQASDFVPTAASPSGNIYADIPTGNWPTLSFVVPPSGRAFVSLSCFLRNTTTTTSTLRAAFRLSGGFTRGASDGSCVSTLGANIGASRRRLITGMTPGATVVVTAQWAASSTSGSSASCAITDGQLLAEPAA